jgi:hypothetical protein
MSGLPDSLPEKGALPGESEEAVEIGGAGEKDGSSEHTSENAAVSRISSPAPGLVHLSQGEERGPDGSAEPAILHRDLPSDIPSFDEPLFTGYEFVPRARLSPRRIPNFGDFLLFLLLGVGGYLASGLVVLAALHLHAFGVATFKQAEDEIHYRLGSQGVWYLITLLLCVWVFPFLWHRSFFDGLEWRWRAAAHYRWRLIGAAVACFAVAILDEILLPGPTNTPIDQTFRMPGAVWLLFSFGVTLAPLMEEIAYRGFLLPALATAYDWFAEHLTGSLAPRLNASRLNPIFDTSPRLNLSLGTSPGTSLDTSLDTNGPPRWSMPAMIVASIVSSIPFALMHGDQTAYSLGPFLLLVGVSLVLSWVRLGMRSLAASVMVHSSYNLLLFSLMFLGTGGFRHLDKM